MGQYWPLYVQYFALCVANLLGPMPNSLGTEQGLSYIQTNTLGTLLNNQRISLSSLPFRFAGSQAKLEFAQLPAKFR